MRVKIKFTHCKIAITVITKLFYDCVCAAMIICLLLTLLYILHYFALIKKKCSESIRIQ